MGDIFEYLKWRDDILITDISEIDVLVFSKLAYFPLERVMESDEKISIHDAYLRCAERNFKLSDYSSKKDKKLFKVISNSLRYKDLYIFNVISKKSLEFEEQFMAVTIELPNNSLYVSYRGTTSELVGWKEDFNMAFSNETPSQIDSVHYLEKLSFCENIYLGGHSKGGNLAMYAAIYSNDDIKKKIRKVYNLDGPGFINLNDKYYSIKDKIVSYIPTCSIIGRLFNLDNNCIVVKSNYNRIWQHSLYSWQIEKSYFVRGKLDEESDKIKNVIDEWLEKTSIDERRDFVNSVYNILVSSGVSKLSEFSIIDLKNIILSYNKMSKDKKKLLMEVIFYLLESTKENLDIYSKK